MSGLHPLISRLVRHIGGPRGTAVAIITFGLLLTGALWGLVLTEEKAEREEIVAAAIKQNSNLAVAYEEHVSRTLKSLDGVLLFLRHEYRRVGNKMNVDAYAVEGIIDYSLFSIVSVTNERGDVVLSSQPIPPVNYADREFFRVHQLRRGRDALHISVPVLGRVSGAWQVPISRPLIKADGSFGGVIVLSVNPDYFTRFYQKAEIGRQGLVSLVGLDGISRARRVGETLSFGDDMTKSALLREQSGNDVGDFVSEGGIDSVSRFVSYRKLPVYPLMVAVGTSRDEVLADFVRNRNRDYFLATLITVVIFGFSVMLVVAIYRQERSVIALATSEARFRATFEQAAIGIVHTSLDRRYIAVNRKFCEMLGYSRDELIGMSATSLNHPDDGDDEDIFKEQLLHGNAESLSAEKRYLRRDGTVIWANRTVSLVRDAMREPLYFLRVVEDITERKRLEEELREMATTDALTGLPNRRAFMTRLEEEFARVRRFDSMQVAVLMIDLDYFKRINDTFGHAAGDMVLRRVAMLIRDETRRVDLCSRIGGEEFAVLLAGAAPSAACDFAERLRGKIAAAVNDYEGRAIPVTASIGIAAMKADDLSADAALQRADEALYQAKNCGRNQVRLMAEQLADSKDAVT